MVEGDVSLIVQLNRVSPKALSTAVGDRELFVTASAVRDALGELLRAEVSGAEVQRWASFIRQGHISLGPHSVPFRPLAIEYESEFEEAIVEVIDRLDQIGDLIDGDIPDHNEIELMLASLRREAIL